MNIFEDLIITMLIGAIVLGIGNALVPVVNRIMGLRRAL